MDKIKLNNQIVLMRKYVKQAKIHIINKLVKQVKMLRNRKGNEVQVQKAKRKAERFLEEITLLKKIRPDDVSKLALSKTSNWEEILQQKNSTLNDRCIAMLASYKAVEKEVKAFHSSNEDLVLKISDLIKQWDEKTKFPKTSSKGKIEKGNRKKEQKTCDRKNKAGIVQIDNSLVNEEEKIKENMIECTKESNKQNKLSFHTSDITAEAVTNTFQEGTDVDCLKNISEKEHLKENIMDVENSNIYEDSEDKDIALKFHSTAKIQKSNLVKNTLETKYDDIKRKKMEIIDSNASEELEQKDSENVSDEREAQKKIKISKDKSNVNKRNNYEEFERSKMEITNSDTNEESEQDDSESVSTETESHLEIKNTIKKNSVIKLEQSSASKFIKKMHNDANSPQKKLKAIAQLNLDQLEGLDEIPVSNKTESDQFESEIEFSEDEADETSYNKIKDPFFLGCGDEDSVINKKISSFSKNNDFSSNDSNKLSKQKNNLFFQRKGNFQKFSRDTAFSRKDGKFQKERDSLKPFQKNKSTARNYPGTFFNRNNQKSQMDFKTKDKSFQNYRATEHEGNSKYTKNSGNKFPVKHLEHKKGSVSDKPLHPSWEAKKKQKELINTSFQGKRMVFDD